MRSELRRGFLPALLFAFLLPGAALAEPGTRACRQLEAQLAALSGGGGGSARRYDEAIGRQREEIGKARAQARRAGCGFALIGGSAAQCGKINATLARMDKNLSELQRKRTQLGGGDTRRDRARIMAALDANGCRAAKRPAATPRTEARAGATAFPPAPGARNLSGNLRTLCVRTCDGYYFPISWSVSSGAFERDTKACQAMCPGTQVELYHHSIADEDSESMVSAATGLPYRDMKSAFLYRQPGASIPTGCGCGAAAAQAASGFQTIGGDYAANEPAGLGGNDAATAEPAVPLPLLRPDAAEDPETLTAREGGLDAEGLKRLATPTVAAPSHAAGGEPADRHVRVVGPVFLPDPEAAIDLQAQAPLPGP